MFERFTASARQVVILAQEEARRLNHSEITAEHLLLSLLADQDSATARILQEFGVRPDLVKAEITGLGGADTDALKAIGIDLDTVRQHAESVFGPGALDQPAYRRKGLFRRYSIQVGGHLPFTESAKQALRQTLQQALVLKHRELTNEHLLLGLIADDSTPVHRTLRRLRVEPEAVRIRLRQELDRAA